MGTGGLLAAGTGGPDEGYVAIGAAPGSSGTGAPPTAGVRLVPLDGEVNSPTARADSSPPSGSGATPQPRVSLPQAAAEPTSPGPSKSPQAPTVSPSPTSPAGPTSTPPQPEPSGPAALTVGDPERTATDRRWCEQVTLDFHNSGGTTVRSGTVTFGTHVIDTLGIDWATIESTEELPAPIAPDTRRRKTWTVCVDAWRVPLGTRVETRDVSVRWE